MNLDVQQRLSAIEEQLNKLDDLMDHLDPATNKDNSRTSAGIIESVAVIRECSAFVANDVKENAMWEKSFSLDLIIQRLMKFVVREARQRNINLTIGKCVQGKIPNLMAETVMLSVMAGLRVILDRIESTVGKEGRDGSRLAQRCLFIHANGTRDSLYVKLMDDCMNGTVPAKQETEFSRVRQAISAREGVCKFSFRKQYGFELVMKAPMPSIKAKAIIISGDDVSFGVAKSLVLEVLTDVHKNQMIPIDSKLYLDYKNDRIPLCFVNDSFGLIQVPSDFKIKNEKYSVVITGAADYVVALLSKKCFDDELVRVVNADQHLVTDSWFNRVLMKTDSNSINIIPLLDGRTILSTIGGWEKQQ